MLKTIADQVVVFDAEWVPDPEAGRRVYGLPDDAADADVVQHMWQEGGASEEEPRPYLKTALCRLVSVAAIVREQRDGPPQLRLQSIPAVGDKPAPEGLLIERFLAGVARRRAQLVGFNSSNADLPILLQRGLAAGIVAADFCRRPNKPWEGVDYFVRYGDWHIDLMEILGGRGKANPSLHEMASVAGIPGKLDVGGADVVTLWQEDAIDCIVAYNQCDAITTYLLWLRLVHFAGLLASDQYEREQQQLEQLLEDQAAKPDGAHLNHYLEAWRALRGRAGAV